MKKLFVAGICLLSTSLMAQTGKVKKTSSYLMPQIALLNGSSGAGAQIQLAGGLVKNNWHLGLGTGIDYYELTSVPVYSDIRYHFGKEKKAFAYANLGYNFHWKESTEGRVYIMPPPNSTVKGGLYTDLGIGYNIGLGKNHSLALSIGYSVKQLTEEVEEMLWGPFPLPVQVDPTIRRYEYTFKRVSFKVAYRLW
jgi:hypothetical protein